MNDYIKEEDRKPVDFIKGEMMFLVEHTQKLDPEEIRAKLLEEGIIDDPMIAAAVEAANPKRVITFERTPRQQRIGLLSGLLIALLRRLDVHARIGPCETPAQYFSVLFATLQRDGQVVEDDDLMNSVQHLDRRVVDGAFSRRRRSLEPKRSIKPSQAAAQRKERSKSDISKQDSGDDSPQPPVIEIPYHPEFTVMAVSPNWTMSSSQGQVATGGPGGLPVDPLTVPKIEIQTIAQPQSVSPVDVYILDTVPTRFEKQIARTAPEVKGLLGDAYKKWGATHELLQTLLGPGSVANFNRLDIVMDDCFRDDGTPLMDYLNGDQTGVSIRGHDYKMTDHGLFVAGIIHSIVPDAKLHLIQVLNDYGVGTTETVLHGLKYVVDNHPSTPSIVNCSLMLGIPNEEAEIRDPASVAGDVMLTMLREGTPISRMGWFTEWVCDLLVDRGVPVVAAAGNDSQPGSRLQARYPAAFASVQGVAAADHNGNPAPYSNVADQPGGDGFITFGGDGTGGTKQIAGIYIGNFPPRNLGVDEGTPSTLGWAYWSGSSFATPAITGLLATSMSGGSPRDLAVQNGFSAAARFTGAGEHWVDLIKS